MRNATLVLTISLSLICAGAIAVAAGTPPRSSAIAFAQIREILSSDAAGADFFGQVSISGDAAIVGAPGNDDDGDWSGSAYIFERTFGGEHNWGQRRKLVASDAQADDAFGGSVAISGDTAVVGADGEDTAGGLVGAAYVFRRDMGGPNNWGEVKKLMPSAPLTNIEGWGRPAIDGDWLVIGCVLSGEVVYLFERNDPTPDNWGFSRKMYASDATTGDRFGRALAISGDKVVVGASGGDDACPGNGTCDSGAAYVFERDEGGTGLWGQAKKLLAIDDAEGDYFGASVAVSGDTVAVGAPRDDDACSMNPNCNSGSVYIFERDHGGAKNWGQVKKLVAFDDAAGDSFGAVALSGDLLLVGSPNDDEACPADPNCDSGSVYVFDRNQGGLGNWGFLTKLTASDAANGDAFGAPSLSGDTAIMGARQSDNPCPGGGTCSSGSAYLFGPRLLKVFVAEPEESSGGRRSWRQN